MKDKKHNIQAPIIRPPIVVVMGHVDHGKTTLLDYIRKAKVAAGEAGGITQAIGAYQAHVHTKEGERLVTFIDTPGHEAFSSMRSRGAKVADIGILVVAADDGVMPQTIEAIRHIQEAEIPMIVAINKTDLPDVHIDKIKRQLSQENVLVEGFGGNVVTVPISAKTGQNVDQLLEMIILTADLVELKGAPDQDLQAIVIESRLDRHRGPIATSIIKQGQMKIGQAIFAEHVKGKVRSMSDEYGKQVSLAEPGKPVEVLGFESVPPIGAVVSARENQEVKEVAAKVNEKKDSVLTVLIKADTIGSLEALHAVLPEEVKILQDGVGDIRESDVLFAKTTGSIIIGFNVKILPQAAKLAELERVIIKTEKIIYRLIEEIEEVVDALKSGGLEEQLGEAKILASFPYNNVLIAGVKVISGRIARGDSVKIIRDNAEIGRSRISSLRTGKTETTKVETNHECGVGFSSSIDFKIGDAIISYRI